MLEKIVRQRDLNLVDVYIEDSDATSKYFEVLESPQVLPPGRSSILINGSPFLKKGTEVLAEILDGEGKPIYINAVANLLEGTARRIGVEVYQTTAQGRAVLTILGEIDPAAVDFVIPEEFQGVYNVRFQKTLSVNPNINNTEPIRFLRRPQIAIEEVIMSQITPEEGVFGVDIVKSGSMYGKRVPYGEQQVVNPANIERVAAILSPVVEPGFETEGTIYNRKFPVKLSSGKSDGMIVRRLYSWGDGTTTSDPSIDPTQIGKATANKQTHEYKKAGTYTARVIVTSPTGQHDEATQLVNISKPQAPVADYSLSQITGSIDSSITFSDLTQGVAKNIDNSTYSDGTTSGVDTEYSWSFGDGTESSQIGQNNTGVALPITHLYNQTGSYLSRLEVHNDYRRQKSFITKPILILPPDPGAKFDIDVSQGEFPLTIAVSSTTESGSAPTHTLGTPTTSAPADIQAVSMSLEWNFGDGNTATGPSTSHTFGISGGSPSSDTTYSVSLKATDQYGRESTETKAVDVIFAAPRADFTQSFAYDTTFPITATFTAQATGSNSTGRDWTAGTFLDSTSYFWTFPGGSPARSTSANPTITYASPNTTNSGWPVTLKIVSTGTAANGNRKSETVTKESLVQVDLPSAPVADYETSRTKGFVPLTVSFANTSQKAAVQNLTYSWDFGDGSGSAAASPTHIFSTVASSGNRSVVLTATDQFGTVGTKTVNINTVSINPSSNWDLQGVSTNLNQGGSRRFYDTSTTPGGSVIVSRQWSFAQGEISQTSAVQNPLITFANAGDVNVSLTTTNSLGGTHTKTVQNYLSVGYEPPTASANLSATSGTTSVTSFLITDTSTTNHPLGISSVTTNWGDGITYTTFGPGAALSHTYETAGTYTPTITVHDEAGSATTSLSAITISNPAGPTAVIESVTSTTSGAPHYQQVQDNSTGTVTSRIWDWGDGSPTSSSPTAGHVYHNAGTFTLELEVTGPGGQTSLAILSVVVDPEIVDGESDTTAEEEGSDNTDTSGDSSSGGSGGGGDGGGCVLEGTLILTDRGYIPVEEVKLDDKVISYDFESEEFRDYEIKKAWNKLQPAWCFIETDLGFNLSCSDTHLIYHPDYKHNEIAVRDLVVGEIIYVYKDEKLYKDNVRNITFYEQEKRVYNFSIDDVKSYISDGILSHNEQKDSGEGTDDWTGAYGSSYASPARITYEIYRPVGTLDDYGTFWKEEMVGGTVTLNDINQGITAYSNLPEPLNVVANYPDVLPGDLYAVNSDPYIFKVLSVLRSGAAPGAQSTPSDNPGIIYPDRGPIVTNKIFTAANDYTGGDKPFLEYQDFGSAEVPIPYTIAYTKPVSMSYDVINKLSYAKVNLSRLRTFSGQIHRVKLYYKSAGELGQHGVLYDGPITSTDTMVDELSITGRRRIGFFSDQATINKYWEAREGENAGRYYGQNTGNIVEALLQGHSGSLTADDSVVMKGMLISGSNRGLNDVVTAYSKDIPGSSALEGFNLTRGVEYSLRAKIFGNKTLKEVESTTGGTSIETKGQLEFYISGSATEEDTPYGKRLGFLEVGPDGDGTSYQDFGVVEHNFEVAKSGNFIIQLVAKSGEWQLRNIMIKPAREVGFSPDVIQLSAKVPPLTRRPDSLQFFVEFYDTNGNLAAKKSVSPAAIQFQGDNVVISGLDNVVSGSLNIGDAIGSGFEFHGGSSAYLRTIGYQGFTSASEGLAQSGFFMWSGSVLPDSNDGYSGVGMEMHAGLNSGSFRFRTYPRAEIDIRTDKFFFGSAGQHISGADGTIAISSSKFVLGSETQFVSGADGNIEISSSNFHLSPTGDVKMKGKVTATSGDIGGWQLLQKEVEGTARTLLSGSNATLDGTGAALYMSNKGPDTNKSDGYYIDFTPADQSVGGDKYFVRFGSNFAIRDDGQLFASGAKIEGILTASEGFIGGWTIGSSSLHKLTGTDYVGMSSTGDTRFFAGAPTLAQSGSGVFNVKADGTLTASNYLFAGSGVITGSVTIGESAVILGSLSAETIHVPTSAAPNYLAKIDQYGFAKFVSASIGGFDVDTVSISDTSNNLILSASGQITGSSVLFDGGRIGRWDIIGDTLSSLNSNNKGIILDADVSTPIIEIRENDNNRVQIYHTDGSDWGLKGISGGNTLFRLGNTNTIAGWTLANDSLSAGSGGSYIALIPGTGIQMGHETFGSAPFSVTNAGVLKATSGTIGGFTLTSTALTGGSTGTTVALTPETGIHMGHATFASAPFSVDKTGVLKATSGTVGGFTLGTNTLTATNFTIDPSGKSITLGSGTDIFVVDGDVGLQLGHGTFASAPFSVTKAGVLKAESGTIAGFTIATTGITSTGIGVHPTGQTYAFTAGSSNEFNVKHSGQVSGSQVLFTGGKVGGWDITTSRITSPDGDMRLTSSNPKITMGSHTFENEGVQLGYNGSGKFGFYAGDGSNNYIHYHEDDGLDIKTAVFNLDTTNLDISSAAKRITVNDGSNDRIYIGEVDGGSVYGMKIFDGSGTADSNILVELGQGGNKIAGWEITGDQIRTIPSAGVGQNYGAGEVGLILHANGKIETSDFVTNLKGWRLDSLGNGTAEFENARIRGTLSTAVFEKETVNAVGGQLLIANSSAITGSVSMSLTDTAFPVENVSGFAAGEIIAIKKISATGFSTEYVQVTGSYRRDAGSETDQSGFLHVSRSYGSNDPIITDSTTNLEGAITSTTETRIPIEDITKVVSLTAEGKVDGHGRQIKIDDERMRISGSEVGINVIHVVRGLEGTAKATHADDADIYLIDTDAEFLSGLVSVASTYEPGQVIVSTGRVGTGYIKLNANPNDMSSPYIDIIERTGSGVYDVELKARLGDLSGLSSGLVYGSSSPGFGLYSENVFLQGAIHAETGSFIGKVHITTDGNNRMLLGTNVNSTDDGIHIGTHNYWYTTGAWKTGGGTYYLSNDASGNVSISAATFDLDATTLIMDSAGDGGTGVIRLGGSGGPSSPTADVAGIYMDGGGAFNLYGDSDNYFRVDAGTMTVKSEDFDLQSAELRIDTSKIYLGTITTSSDTSGTGTFFDTSGNFRVQGDANNYLRVTAGGAIAMKADDISFSASTFTLDATELYISSANQRIALGADGSAVGYQGSGIFLGEDGSGVYKFSLKSSSGDSFSWNGAGQLDITGNITADSGNIGGWTVGADLSAGSTTTTIRLIPGTGIQMGHATFGSAPFSVTNAGVLKAESGTIGGWTLGATTLSAGSGGGYVEISATGGDSSNGRIRMGAKNTRDDGNAGVHIDTTGIAVGGNSVFKVTSAGVLTSISGTIGGWTIGSTLSATNIILNPAGPNIQLAGKTTFADNNVDGVYIGTEGIAIGDDNEFAVTNAGAVTMTNATITGGGITINNLFTVNSDGDLWIGHATQGSAPFQVDNAGAVIASNITISGGGISIGSSNTIFRVNTVGDMWIGHATEGSAPFQVDNTGAVIASDITISGGGISIGSSNTIFRVKSDGDMWIGHATEGSAPFQVDNTGALIASSATITGAIKATSGFIGGTSTGWDINTGNITSTGGTKKITLDATGGKIYIGTGTYNNDNTPFYADGASQFSLGDALTFDGADLEIEGNITATGGSFTGNVTAGSVTIGTGGITGTGYTINASGIQLSGASTIDINSVFTVSSAGALMASSGAIAGWTIDSTAGIYKLDSGTPSSSPNNGITIENAGGSNSKGVIRAYDGTTLNAAIGNYASGKYGLYGIEGEIGGFVIGSDQLTTAQGTGGTKVGFGTTSPEAKLHVVHDVSDLNEFSYDTNLGSLGQSWWADQMAATEHGKTAYGIKGQLIPFTSTGTQYDYLQAGIGLLGITDSYRIRNFGLYMETVQGQDKGWSTTDFDVSGSYGFGVQYSFASSKVQIGARLRMEFGPGQSTAANTVGEILQVGMQVYQGKGLEVDYNSRQWDTTGGLTQCGIEIFQEGQYDVQPTAHTYNTSHVTRDPSDIAGVYVNNLRTGTYGPTAGYGLYVSGSNWKSFIDGALRVAGGTRWDKSPSYTLDVTGDIRATGNVIAYSDARDKENVDTISGSIDIVNNIRGVRFDWNDAYKRHHVHKNQQSQRLTPPTSGSLRMIDPRLEGRQIGVIAQEVEPILPELVFEDDDGRKNVSYANLTAVLVEAVKEQQEQIEELKQEVKEIKNAKNRNDS